MMLLNEIHRYGFCPLPAPRGSIYITLQKKLKTKLKKPINKNAMLRVGSGRFRGLFAKWENFKRYWISTRWGKGCRWVFRVGVGASLATFSTSLPPPPRLMADTTQKQQASNVVDVHFRYVMYLPIMLPGKKFTHIRISLITFHAYKI